MGPEAGAKGGMVIAEGTIEEIEKNEASVIGRYLSGKQKPARPKAEKNIFSNGGIRMKTEWIHTVRPLTVRIPRTGRWMRSAAAKRCPATSGRLRQKASGMSN